MTAELFRPVSVAKIGAAGLTVAVRATPEECAGLAGRMDIPAIRSLECTFRLTREGDGVSIAAAGELRAIVDRVCAISAEAFETPVQDSFTIRFVPAGMERDDPDPALEDEIPYEHDSLDLGEAAAEQLALALDPYPRMPGAALPEIEDDGDASPFAILRRGKDG